DMPEPDPMFLSSALWLAYASGGHFAGATNYSLRPLVPRHEAWLAHPGHKAPGACVLSHAPPFLPLSAAYYDEGRAHPRDGSRPVQVYPGFTNVTYTPTFTNFGGFALPAAFTLCRLDVAFS